MDKSRYFLNHLRREVDLIDHDILKFLKNRFFITNKIGEFKKENEIKIKDKLREEQVLNNLKLKSKEINLNEIMILDIYKIIIDESKKAQK